MRLILSLAVGVVLLCGGCTKPAIAGAPVPLIVPYDANPDVIWLVRPIATERDDQGDVTLYGLFACYRSAEPGVPQCFLATTAGTEQDLVWPDDAGKYRISPK
jgi:hypothetical protein